MTTDEKFDILAKGGECFAACFRAYGVGRNQTTLYPHVTLIGRGGVLRYNILFSDNCFPQLKAIGRTGYYDPDESFEEVGEEGHMSPILGGNDIETYLTHRGYGKGTIPVRFMETVTLDRFTGLLKPPECFKITDYGTGHYEQLINRAYEMIKTPEYKYGIVLYERVVGTGYEKPKSMQDLRGIYTRRLGEESHKSVDTMYKVMSPKKETKRSVLTRVKKAIKRRLNKVKKVTEREQNFFSMMLGSQKIGMLSKRG